MSYQIMINQVFSTFCKSLFISLIVYLIEYLAKVEFAKEFFSSNLVILLTTVLAINIATIGVILSRIAALNQGNEHFLEAKKQILFSIKELIGLIFTALILSILTKMNVTVCYAELFSHGISVLFITVFVYSIFVLYDVAKGLIDIH
ncbi:hypothetical protein [Moraxella marmotae]|uniref:hypothetical protein n=1 Tax=Moraxella marmotae TaxID=3344520 RepID=UPI0035F42F8E